MLGSMIADIITEIGSPRPAVVKKESSNTHAKANPKSHNVKEKSKEKRADTPLLDKDMASRYNSPAVALVAKISKTKYLSVLGMLVVLQSIIPPEGGVINISRLARSVDMTRKHVRAIIDHLEELGLINSEREENGRFIWFNSQFTLQVNAEAGIESEVPLQKASGWSSPFTETLLKKEAAKVKECYFWALNSVRQKPESMHTDIFKIFGELEKSNGIEYAAAFIINFLPLATSNQRGFLQKTYKTGSAPTPASLESAKKVISAAEEIFKEVGHEILPSHWTERVQTLGIIPVREIAKIRDQQEEYRKRVDNFVTTLDKLTLTKQHNAEISPNPKKQGETL